MHIEHADYQKIWLEKEVSEILRVSNLPLIKKGRLRKAWYCGLGLACAPVRLCTSPRWASGVGWRVWSAPPSAVAASPSECPSAAKSSPPCARSRPPSAKRNGGGLIEEDGTFHFALKLNLFLPLIEFWHNNLHKRQQSLSQSWVRVIRPPRCITFRTSRAFYSLKELSATNLQWNIDYRRDWLCRSMKLKGSGKGKRARRTTSQLNPE